jgi:hypothetical protein
MQHLLSDTENYKQLKKDTSQQINRKLNSSLRSFKPQLGEQLYKRLRASEAQTPEMYGLVKLHKLNYPMRPIVSYVGSSLYNLSQWISELLCPLVGKTEFHVKNSTAFAKDVRAVSLDPGETIVSYDVVGLFPSIPIDFALETIHAVITSDNLFLSRCPVPRETFLSLMEFLLKSTVFKFEGKFYEQVSGVPMGSPCSVAVSNIVMERLEREAIHSLGCHPKFYRRFIDDVFCVLRADLVDALQDCLNRVHARIQVTVEHPQNNSLPFLDVLVRIDGDSLTTTVYRKPTNTGRYLSFDSSHPVSQKRAVVQTLVRRARDICQTPEDLQCELSKIRRDLTQNGYPQRLIDSCINYNRPDKLPLEQQILGYACVPFMPGLSEPLTRVLCKFNVKVVHIPFSPLRSRLQKTRTKCNPFESTCVVYNIPCRDCNNSYVGQTSRFLSTRIREHRNDKRASSALTEHVRATGHSPAFDLTTVVAKKDRYFDRVWTEAWEIASRELKGCALSNRNSGCVTVPEQYRPFFT